MKRKNTKRIFMPLWVIISVLIFAACSNEEIDGLKVEKSLSKNTIESAGDPDLKKGNNAQNQILAQIRRATAKYHDIDVAAADGYMLDPHCVEHPEYGAMGQHAVNMYRIVPFVNPAEPGVLVYEPMQNGEYKLVAAEFLVPAGPWDDNNDGPPMLGNVEFDDHRAMIGLEDENGDPVLDEEGNQVFVNAKGGPPFPHYQLHVWVWKNNPLGMYFPFNPNVSCQYASHEDMD
jgi:hypothetical protein